MNRKDDLVERNSRDKLESLIEEAEVLKARHLDAPIDWYQMRSALPRKLFRSTGYALIFLSISLPFLTALSFRGSDLAVAFVALLVAALAGVSSFAQWDAQWRSYKRAQFALEGLQAQWDLKILEARQMANSDDAIRAVLEAAQVIIQSAKEIVSAETEQFFEAVKPPQTLKKS